MNKEPITLHLETFNNEEYILADECIEAIGLHRRTNTELHQTIEEKDREIERLTAESTKWESKFYDEAKKVDKAIEYIEERKKYKPEPFYLDEIQTEILYEILKGSDKE